MLVLYSGIVILALTVMITMSVYQQQKNVKEQNQNTYINIAKQFKIYTDQYALKALYSLIGEKIFYEYSYSTELILDTEGYLYDGHNYDKLLEIREFLLELASGVSFINSIDIYNIKYDTFISSELGGYYRVSDRRLELKTIISYPTLDYALDKELSQFWIPPSAQLSFYKNTPMLSFVQQFPVFSTPEEAEILFIININLKSIFQNFVVGYALDNQKFVILDQEDQVVFSSDQAILESNRISDDILTLMAEEPDGCRDLTLTDGKCYTAVWLNSSENDWRYLYLAENDSIWDAVFSSLIWFFIGVVIVTLVFVGAVIVTSKWLYAPIRRLVNTSRPSLAEKEAEIKERDDISLIDAAFDNLRGQVDDLEHVLGENKSLILTNLVDDMVHGKITEFKELNERLHFLGKSFQAPAFLLMCTKVDEMLYEKMEYGRREMLHIGIIDYIDRFYNNRDAAYYKAVSTFRYTGLFITVINTEPDNYQKELVQIRELQTRLSEQCEPIFNIAVSRPITAFEEFAPVCDELLTYFKYAYVYGNNNIFTKENIEEYNQKTTNRDADPIPVLAEMLRNQNMEQAKNEITRIFHYSKAEGYSFLYTYNLALQIISLIGSECARQNISAEALNLAKMLEDYSGISKLEDTVSWFHSILDQFSARLLERKEGLDGSVVSTIMEYVRSHVDNQLTLNSVAEEFGLSAGHISRLFKDKTGTNFSDFLIEVKFEAAANRLVCDPGVKIADLAEELGYANLPYFTKLFKERYGVTPTQYRKLHASGHSPIP